MRIFDAEDLMFMERLVILDAVVQDFDTVLCFVRLSVFLNAIWGLFRLASGLDALLGTVFVVGV